MLEIDINPQQKMHVVAIDVDITAVYMSYVQFTLLNIPAVVVHGNALTMETFSEWKTLAHVTGFWDSKLKRYYAQNAEKKPTQPLAEQSTIEIVAKPKDTGIIRVGEQLRLF